MANDVKILGMPPESGRWLLIIIGTIIELCLGAVYAYSIISVPLKKIFTAPVAEGGFGLTVSAMQMSLPYIASLAFFALTMPLVGKYIEKYGPRKVGMLGGVIVGLGWILGSTGTSPTMLMILYGVIAGIGVGIAYNCPITTAARWFADKRGLALKGETPTRPKRPINWPLKIAAEGSGPADGSRRHCGQSQDPPIRNWRARFHSRHRHSRH